MISMHVKSGYFSATMNLRLKKLGYSAPHALMKSLGMPEDDLPPQVTPELHSYWQ